MHPDTARTPDGEITIGLPDSLNYEHAGRIWEEVIDILEKDQPRKIKVDFRGTGKVDSAGIALLRLLRRRCLKKGIDLQFESVPPSCEYFLRYIESEPVPPSERPSFSLSRAISSLGTSSLRETLAFRDLVRFQGELLIAALKTVRSARHFRWKEVYYYLQLAGAEAMPIVFLLSFLIGLVMAFQAAVQLRQFGANIYVADMLSLALTRELGPVFTAVILAGRSGAAFAAEIGTMKVSEEVDALVVMGFDITQFLVLPKVIALALCGPLLTMWANASGIFGGIVVGVLTLDITPASFLQQSYNALVMTDILSGLIKSLVFSVLVALIGCFRGLQASKGADSVGRQTTSAVVSGIFLIILADAVFTIIFHVFDW